MKILIIFLFSFLIPFNLYAIPGVIVVAGGGPEGELDETSAWSYPLYKRLIDNGSIHNNGKIKAVVVSLDHPETTFIADYLKQMGATNAINITVDSKKAANDPKIVGTLADADVIFFRGGNQGDAYRFWKDTLLHKYVNEVAEKGGAIGGTSSGAMGLSEYSMTGGTDFDSSDLLANPKSKLLNDLMNPSQSGIHNDFLNLVPGVIIDTHCAQRARIGRLLAVHAKATEDYQNKNIVAICVEEKTGIAIKDGKAEVYGTGIVHFLNQTPDSKMIRTENRPLVYTDIRDDALTEKWIYDLKLNTPDMQNVPKEAMPIDKRRDCGSVLKKSINSPRDFEYTIDPKNKIYKFSISPSPALTNVLPIFNAHTRQFRDINQTLAFRTLFDLPNSTILLIPSNIQILADQTNDQIQFKNAKKTNNPLSTILLDCSKCTFKSKSNFISSQDQGKNSLVSSGFINARINILSDEQKFNIRTQEVVFNQDEINKINPCLRIDLILPNISNLNQFETINKQIEKCN
jgi:cyanophycinase